MDVSLPTLFKEGHNGSLFWYNGLIGWNNNFMFVIGDVTLEEEIGKRALDRFKERLLGDKKSALGLIGFYNLFKESTGNMRVSGRNTQVNHSDMLYVLESRLKSSDFQLDSEKIIGGDLFIEPGEDCSSLYQGFTHSYSKDRFFVPAEQFDYVQKTAFACSDASCLSLGEKREVIYISLEERFAGIAIMSSRRIKTEFLTRPQ